MQRVAIVADLGFGDSGKGTTVDWLARRQPTSLIVRYNGGAQALHHVVTPEGKHHPFQQFGSGHYLGTTRTFLSRFMIVDPWALRYEAEHLAWEFGGTPAAQLDRLWVDPDAVLVTPFHRALGRIRELTRGSLRHGSCGRGIGEAARERACSPGLCLRARDLINIENLGAKLEQVQARCLLDAKRFVEASTGCPLSPGALMVLGQEWNALEEPEAIDFFLDELRHWVHKVQIGTLDRLVTPSTPLIFEGAHGVLLDEWYGFHPYTTWSTNTFAHANELLYELGIKHAVRVGVTRALPTRHGPGPFPSEHADLADLRNADRNTEEEWQGPLRVGHFDVMLARYASEVLGSLDLLVVTHLDAIARGGRQRRWPMVVGYQDLGPRLAVDHPATGRTLWVREAATQRLLQAIPLTETVGKWNYVEVIQQHLMRGRYDPVLESHGPSAKEKSWSRVTAPADDLWEEA